MSADEESIYLQKREEKLREDVVHVPTIQSLSALARFLSDNAQFEEVMLPSVIAVHSF